MLLRINGLNVIGITGNLASGKSSILRSIKVLGFHTISCDDIVHDLLTHDESIINKITKLFPNAVTNKSINKNILAQEVFPDSKKLKSLQKILYPKLDTLIQKKCLSLRHSGLQNVFIEVPLLFETRAERFYNTTVMIHCPKYKRVVRYMNRHNSTQNIPCHYKSMHRTIDMLSKLRLIMQIGRFGKIDNQKYSMSNSIRSKDELVRLFNQIEGRQINEHQKIRMSDIVIYNG